jgi:cell division protein FtsL
MTRRAYLAGLAVLVALLGVMMIKPLESLTTASDRVDELQRQRDELAAEVAELQARRDDLSRPEEIELLAREELGMVAPGEVPLVVVTPDAPPPAQEPAPAADRPWYARVWERLSRPFRS